MPESSQNQYGEKVSSVLTGNVKRIGVIPRHWDSTLCQRFSVTPSEQSALKWIMKGFASWRMYGVLYPLPVRTFWGKQNGVYSSCPNPSDGGIKSMGYGAPEAFLIFCGDCAEFGRHYFTPCVFDSDLIVLSGFAKCDRCQKLYKVWLMELKGDSNDGNWTEAWINPKPGETKSEFIRFIPEEFSEVSKNYKEAKELLEISPRASAAICRVALESIITDKLGVRERDLYEDIKKIYFFKNKKTKAVIQVTFDEARLCLEILEDLIEILFVLPAIRKQRKNEFKNKMSDGKE